MATKNAPSKTAAAPKFAGKSTAAAPAKSAKPAKNKPAPAEVAAPAGKRGKPMFSGAYGEHDTINILVAENPHRSEARASRFKLYKEGMTVGKFVSAGGTMEDIRRGVRKGHIQVNANA